MRFSVLKFKSIFFSAVLLCAFVLFSSACGSAPVSDNQDMGFFSKRALARKLVEKDWAHFRTFSMMDFRDRVSDKFIPDKAAFIKEVENTFYEVTPLDLSFSVDQALLTGDKLAVSLTWQKKVAVWSSGDIVLKKGKGTIVYIKEADQWRIYQVTGNSIFTF